MIGPLFAKLLRDSWLALVLLATGAALLPGLVLHALPSIPLEPFQRLLQLPFLRKLLMALAGADLAGALTPTGIAAFFFVHPVVAGMTWAFQIIYNTRVIAGEISSGTADLLFTLPIRRAHYLLAASTVWFGAGAVLSVAPLAGAFFGTLGVPDIEPLKLPDLFRVAAAAFAVYLAGGAVILFISACSSRRAVAVGAALAFLFVSDAVHFLAAFWPLFERLSVFSLLHYMQPLPIVNAHALPLRDITTMAAVALAFWIVAMVVFVRRDIRTG